MVSYNVMVKILLRPYVDELQQMSLDLVFEQRHGIHHSLREQLVSYKAKYGEWYEPYDDTWRTSISWN